MRPWIVLGLLSSNAFAFGLLATAGYESQTPEKLPDDEITMPKFQGLGASAILQHEFAGAAILGLVVGGGLRLSYLTSEFELSGIPVKVNQDNTYGTLEVGGSIAVVPKLVQIQAVGHYDHALNGKTKVTVLTSSESTDLDSGSGYGVSSRVLMTLFPFVSVGLDAGWSQNKTKLKDSTKERTSSGYQVGIALGVNL